MRWGGIDLELSDVTTTESGYVCLVEYRWKNNTLIQLALHGHCNAMF